MSTNRRSVFKEAFWSLMLLPAGYGSLKSMEALSHIGVMPFMSLANLFIWFVYVLPICIWICSCFIKNIQHRNRLVGVTMIIYSILNIVDAWVSLSAILWLLVLSCSCALLLPATLRVEAPLRET